MPKVYALSTIIGDGSDDNPFGPAVMDYPVNWVIAIAPDHETNTSKQWVLCVIAGTQTNLNAISADNRNYLFPFGPANLDQAWTTLGTNNQRNQWANRLSQQTGVVVTRDDPRTLREIINLVGLAVDPNFNASNMDVRE
jgi:hypothetical protein